MFDLRGKPGYCHFPFRIGDNVVLKGGIPIVVMKVVDFDDKGSVTAAWREAGSRKLLEKTLHHAGFTLWDGVE